MGDSQYVALPLTAVLGILLWAADVPLDYSLAWMMSVFFAFLFGATCSSTGHVLPESRTAPSSERQR